MPRMFIKLDDKKKKTSYFFEWSTISDAPNSQVVEIEDFEFMYHQLGYSDFINDMQRLNKTGVSSPHYSLEELLEMSDDFDTEEKLLEFCRTFVN